MGAVVLLAFTAAFNPTEIAAVTVMLLLRNPERLMLGYWLGAMTTGIASGLVIVFALQDSAEQSTKHTVSPVVQLVFAALLIVAAIALAKGGGKRLEKKEKEKKKDKEDKKPPRWQRTLEKGNAWQTFVVGILLSFPGASYLAALDRLIHLHYSAFAVVLILVGFNLIQNLLLEIPMLAFRIWPTETPAAIDRAKAWVGQARQDIRCLGTGDTRRGAGDHQRHRTPVGMT